MWRLFLINCAMCRAWKLHRMCCCAVSRKGGGWIWFGLLQKIEGTRMKHSRQIKGVSWGWSVEEVPPRVCCCNQCPALKSQWQCMRSHRNPIQGIYGAGTLTHMAIHTESNIRGGLRLQYICACTLHIATHQWAANKRMCAHAQCTCSEIFLRVRRCCIWAQQCNFARTQLCKELQMVQCCLPLSCEKNC